MGWASAAECGPPQTERREGAPNSQLQKYCVLRNMKRRSPHLNVNSIKSCSTRARDLMEKMEMMPHWSALYLPPQSVTYLRPHSSPCRVYSRTYFQHMFRPLSTGERSYASRNTIETSAIANPILSPVDVKRILFQKITDKGDELKKAFQLLDPGQSLTVSKSELRRAITTFLLPLTRKQFQNILAQTPLTSSGAVPYLEFLSKFGGLDLNVNVIKRRSGNEMNQPRTVKELELQLGDKVSRNSKSILKAFQLVDVNGTGLVKPQDLRRVLETFCLKMSEDEYDKFSSHYNIDKNKVDYNVFLKNLSVNNDKNLRQFLGNQELSGDNQQVKKSCKKYLAASELSEDTWKHCSIDEIQRFFCQELLKSYERVEKGLSAGDTCNSGYVSFNYLKTVLDAFVYRLPRRTFLQLMKRFGLKTTSKINWKQFLTSFYYSSGLSDSSAIPTSRRNSSNSFTTSRNQPSKENIIAKLYRHAEDDCISLKKALMTSSTKYDGNITKKELQNILNSRAIKISDSEFKELMQMLDPAGSGLANINTFLDLLEDENLKIRKRPPSPDTKAPPLLAWESVEEMVRDGITKDLPGFYHTLRSCDPGDTGFISRMHFKKIMRTSCPFLTGEHLIKLCSKFQDITSGRILYKKLLSSIGINGLRTTSPLVIPTDLPLSEPVPKEAQLGPALPERTKPTEEKLPLTKNLTMEEVIEKLKNCIQQHDPAFRKRFLDFSKEPGEKINPHDFRKVLEANGMPMTDDQYALLATKIGLRDEGISYLDFATGFEDSEMSRPASTAVQTPILTKNYMNSHFITAEECLKLFPKRLKESFRDPYAAFFKMDTDRDGIISMQDLHRLLMHLLFNLRDKEFVRFLELLGLKLSLTLNFREFRNLCEKGAYGTEDAPQRLNRPKQKVTDSELACEQAHQYLVTKAKNRWPDLSKNFIETDNENNGILRRRDIKNALYGFDIPLTPREFEKLWTRYDTEGRGYITYQEFLQKLGINYSPAVHRPYAEDYFNFMGHFTKPKQMQEEIKELQQNTERATRDKLKDHFQEISKTLTKLDKSKTGCISMSKLQKVLQDCGCFLKEGELAALLTSLGVSWQDNSVKYLDFLKAVDSSAPVSPLPLEKAVDSSVPVSPLPPEKEESVPISFAALSPEDVVKKVQEVVNSSHQALSKTFLELDKEDTGFLKAADFGQVLKDLCYELSDNQYHYFLRKLKLHLISHINWKYFLQNFSSFLEETAADWAEKMPKAPLPPKSPPPKDKKDILARLHKAVTTHYNAIAQEFENFDTMKNNTASREEFRAICNRHVQILTDEQFDKLWSEMPVNAKGKLRYQDFLRKFSSQKALTPPASGDSTRAQKGSSAPELSEEPRSARSSPLRDLKGGAKTWSHPCTPASLASKPFTPPLQNCEPIESKLRRKMQGCWRELLKECKEKDVNKLGEIRTAEFLALVEKFHLDISKEESQQLITKYDLKNTGRFAYCDFIQNCILLLKAKETSLMQRMKIQNAHRMKEAGVETSSFYSALLRIQPKILHCWRPMRRTFKTYDEGGTGLLNVADFRKVLRQYSINLSEEEFFHILEYYDKTLSSKISYNDFLRAFLQ